MEGFLTYGASRRRRKSLFLFSLELEGYEFSK